MKKLLLLLVSASIAMGAKAQERHMTVMPSLSQDGTSKAVKLDDQRSNKKVSSAAAKTTAGGNRYYSYRNHLDTTKKIESGGATGALDVSIFIWNDTNMIYQFTGTTPGSRHVNMTSIASMFHPHTAGYNDSTLYEGLMKLTTSNAYTVDSVFFFGRYRFNPAKTTIVDTLRLSFVKGNGGSESSDDIFSGFSTSGGFYGTATFHDIHYDSIKNYARSGMAWGTPSSNVKDILISNANWGDTDINGIMNFAVQLPTALNVSAGGFAAMSWTFISGDPAHSTSPTAPTGGDTLSRANGSIKFNHFLPFVACQLDLGSEDIQWPPYSPTEHNTGYFKNQPTWGNGWSETYVPQWAWSSTTSAGATVASSYQYPDVTWHVTCASCGVITNTPVVPGTAVNNVRTISTANAYPNPAANQLSVPFTLSQSAQVTVTISNMLGQVVATQNMGNVTSGTAVINTTAMPNGVYSYTVTANNERSTGRVSIAH